MVLRYVEACCRFSCMPYIFRPKMLRNNSRNLRLMWCHLLSKILSDTAPSTGRYCRIQLYLLCWCSGSTKATQLSVVNHWLRSFLKRMLAHLPCNSRVFYLFIIFCVVDVFGMCLHQFTFMWVSILTGNIYRLHYLY